MLKRLLPKAVPRPFAAIAGLLVLAAAPGAAADAGLEQLLTGGSSRAWVLHEVVRPPVAGDACASGAVLTFAMSHDMQATRCRNGHLAASHHAWAVRPGRDGAQELEIAGAGTYEATAGDAQPGPPRLRLHATSVAPGWPAGDMELRLDGD